MTWRRLRTLRLREGRATLRDPFTLLILVAVPIGAMLLFGFVLSTEVHGLRLAVLDADGTPQSRRLVNDLAADGSFRVEPVRDRAEIDAGLVDGRIGAALIIPPGFGRDVGQGGPPPQVLAIYDGAEVVLAGNAEGFLRGIVASSGARLARQAAPQRAPAPGGVAVDTRALFNPDLRGTPFMVAGTFGFVLSFLTTLITAVTIVNERMAGTFEQLQVTPATTLEILLGKLLPLGSIFAFDVALMMFVAAVGLDVRPNGSALLFWAISAFYVMTSLAMGLIFSATSATAAEAVQKTVLFSIPLVQLSGFAFPIRNMPAPVQWLAEMFPATHYIRVSRAIYLRGEGVTELLPELAILALFAVLQVGAAVRTLESRA